jgi:hypothetical protein
MYIHYLTRLYIIPLSFSLLPLHTTPLTWKESKPEVGSSAMRREGLPSMAHATWVYMYVYHRERGLNTHNREWVRYVYREALALAPADAAPAAPGSLMPRAVHVACAAFVSPAPGEESIG